MVKVMFLHMSLILFTEGWGLPSGLGLPSHNDMKRETPLMQAPPAPGRPLRQILLYADPSMQTPLEDPTPFLIWSTSGSTHPTRMHTCIVIFVEFFITQSAIQDAIKVIIFHLSCLSIEIENRVIIKNEQYFSDYFMMNMGKEFSQYFI